MPDFYVVEDTNDWARFETEKEAIVYAQMRYVKYGIPSKIYKAQLHAWISTNINKKCVGGDR